MYVHLKIDVRKRTTNVVKEVSNMPKSVMY